VSLAQALFAPRAVALVGASGDAAKNSARPLRFLRKHGYAGRILPINASRSEVLGERAFSSLAAAPGAIDHAFIMTPGDSVERAIEECGARGVPVATIFSDGFADAGAEGAARQARLVARARELGVRVLGPNSMGLVDVPGRVALTVNAVLEMEALPAGTTSFVSHSGTMLGTVLSRGAARGLGFAKLVSVGNEADVGMGELVELLAEDPGTRVILLFLETIRDGAKLAAAARKAHAAGKPVVAYKLGRSRLGAALARSHTGALAGEDAALDAYFRDCGIVRVDMLETLLEIAPLVTGERRGSAGHVRHRDGRAGLQISDHRSDDDGDGGAVHRSARRPPRVATVRRRARGGRIFCAVPSGPRRRAHRAFEEEREAARGFPHAPRGALACPARRARDRRVPHARGLRRRACRHLRLALAPHSHRCRTHGVAARFAPARKPR
jgi:acyl-CoA synthetase (NDP forming)